MDKNTLLYLILAALGLWAAFIAVRLLAVWLQLMRMHFGPGDIAPADRTTMPAEVAAILDATAARLAALGFAHEETLLAQSMLRRGEQEPTWIDVHVHRESGTRAAVQLAEAPEPGIVAAVSFVTDYEHSMLETENRRLHLLLPVPAHCQLADAMAANLGEHWAFHCRRAAGAGEGAPITDPTMVRERHRAMRADILEHCQRIGAMRAEGDQCRFTARGAWRYLRQVLAGNRRVAALPPHEEVEDLPLRVRGDARAWRAQEALNRHIAMSRRGKVFWFAVSTLAGAAAFGYLVSWEMAPAILGVLLFHEFGHALAMRAVGYHGLSVLVLPFLGAVAIGRKDNAGPWQKLAVLIAGPLPGLILAVICLRVSMSLADPQLRGLASAVGWMALSINLFNLLPFTPLDGGQIMDTFLFSRRPRLRFGFFVVSVGALVATAVALDSIPLGGAALLLAAVIPAAWRRLRLLKGLDTLGSEEAAVDALFERIHATPGRRVPAFAHRVQTVRMLLPWLSGRAPTWRESLAGVAVYIAAVAMPAALLWDTGLPHQAFLALVSSGSEAARPDWDAQLSDAKTPEARWKVLWSAAQWFEEAEDGTQALQYYQLALDESARLPDDPQKPLRTLDARLAVARYSEPDVTRPVYLELIPTLRELPSDERWRLAQVLESLSWLDAKATPETRIERFREAIATREALSDKNWYNLLYDREQLARLLDAQGDAEAAEALLRKNLAHLETQAPDVAVWQTEPVAWFLIAHDRAAEAEALLAAQPMPARHGESLRSTWAWSLLAQGKTAPARKILTEALEKAEKQRWSDWQRLMLLLDAVHASTDAPQDEARWLEEAANLRKTLGPKFRGGRHLLSEAKSSAWEKLRHQGRLAAYARLPGTEDELSEEGRPGCKPDPSE